MTRILEPAKHTLNIEYHVKRHGGLYAVGTKHAYIEDITGWIHADIYLNSIADKQTVKVLKPKVLNPFHMETELKRISNSVFYVRDVWLYHCPSLDAFILGINKKLFSKYGKKINKQDGEAFFSKMHEHYSHIYDAE